MVTNGTDLKSGEAATRLKRWQWLTVGLLVVGLRRLLSLPVESLGHDARDHRRPGGARDRSAHR